MDSQAISRWFLQLPSRTWDETFPSPACSAIVAVGMVTGIGFGRFPASPHVATLIRPIKDLFLLAHARGVRRFLLVQRAGLTQTRHAAGVPTPYLQEKEGGAIIGELQELPFADTFAVIHRPSVGNAIATDVEAWLRVNPDLQTIVMVGNCTDLWMYQMGTYLWLRASALQLPRYQVVVPADMARTGDLSRDAALQCLGGAHPNELFHQIFLYYLSKNNVEVICALEEFPRASGRQCDDHSPNRIASDRAGGKLYG
jgi:hypothetical protein